MARLARAEVFAADEIAIVHVMNRTVRRCFLLVDDPARLIESFPRTGERSVNQVIVVVGVVMGIEHVRPNEDFRVWTKLVNRSMMLWKFLHSRFAQAGNGDKNCPESISVGQVENLPTCFDLIRPTIHAGMVSEP